jgi:hypothetical protein
MIAYLTLLAALLSAFVPLTVALCVGIARYMKSAVETLRLTIQLEMDRSNATQLEKINGTFIPAASSKITGIQIEASLINALRQIERVARDVKALERYARSRIHLLRNKVLALELTQHNCRNLSINSPGELVWPKEDSFTPEDEDAMAQEEVLHEARINEAEVIRG